MRMWRLRCHKSDFARRTDGAIQPFASRGLGYPRRVQPLAETPDLAPALNQMIVPDLWQQQAVTALRDGKDVVVQAPTGSGKTLIFEVWSNLGKPRGQAIYTVPTRALANDKLAEWRARGWNVGISTGDLSDNLDAPVLVATLETQKGRLIRGEGPALLVIDEYQMIADADRGLNYELAIALAPAHTQLLMLSGSVSNPQEIVRWLNRLGRRAELVRHEQRPVPLEEVFANNLNYSVPSEIRGYWPRFLAKALAEDLGPVLVFAPRRAAAEAMAAEVARWLPVPNPLQLSDAQRKLAGEHLAKMLKARVAYHHSGLSYAVRAGLIEPLAKAGQLRVVVATMGLAAGINFSLRSVALAGESYRRDAVEHPLRGDEILQMAGRAGRRGIDEVGFFLISGNGVRLREGHPCHLARSGMVDWSALLSLMWVAADEGQPPFAAAVRAQERLFTTKPVFLGVEESLKHPVTPCGLATDAERARHVRLRVVEMLNSAGEWETTPKPANVPVRDVRVFEPLSEGALTLLKLRRATVGRASRPPSAEHDANAPAAGHPATAAELEPVNATLEASGTLALRSALAEPRALDKLGDGLLHVLSDDAQGKVYGRELTVAEPLDEDRVRLTKWIRRMTNWGGREAPLYVWRARIQPLIEQKLAAQKTPVVRFEERPDRIVALTSLAEMPLSAFVDAHGVALWQPPTREVMPNDCARCELVPACRKLTAATGTALLWRRLGLVDEAGVPTRRGKLVSYFSGSNGLAIAAAIEDERYPLDELIYDVANLDAGFRFCGEEHRWGGRLARASQRAYGNFSVPGYLENGMPPRYGAGAEAVVAAIHRNPLSKQQFINELTGVGDIDRVIIEWRSQLRQMVHSREIDVPRWTALKAMAKAILRETESPTLTELPPLEHHQTRRVDHRLKLRQH
jgi:superfamily II DNA/RNA helicase